MRRLKQLLFVFALGVTCTAHAVDQDLQAEVLLAKIVTLVTAGSMADALPYFAQYEAMGKTLSEDFLVLYLDTLERAGDRKMALNRANAYLDKYGKKGKSSSQVIETKVRLELQADKDAKEAMERRAREEKERAISNAAAETKRATDIIKSKVSDAHKLLKDLIVGRRIRDSLDFPVRSYRGNGCQSVFILGPPGGKPSDGMTIETDWRTLDHVDDIKSIDSTWWLKIWAQHKFTNSTESWNDESELLTFLDRDKTYALAVREALLNIADSCR